MERMKLLLDKDDRLFIEMDERLVKMVQNIEEDNTLEIRPVVGAISGKTEKVSILWASWANQFMANMFNGNELPILPVGTPQPAEGFVAVEVHFGWTALLNVSDVNRHFQFSPDNTNVKEKGAHTYELIQIAEGGIETSFRIDNGAMKNQESLSDKKLREIALDFCIKGKIGSYDADSEEAGASLRTIRLACIGNKPVLRVGYRVDLCPNTLNGPFLLAGSKEPFAWNYIATMPLKH